MIVYRIVLEKYSKKLEASGIPARWNTKDVKIIYTAQSRALACLENIVHRNSRGLQKNFRVMKILVPDDIFMEEIKEIDLKKGWKEFNNMPDTQSIGNLWVHSARSAILKVPSAIVSGDFNYLLNPGHKEYFRIKLLQTEPFEFDDRIKEN